MSLSVYFVGTAQSAPGGSYATYRNDDGSPNYFQASVLAVGNIFFGQLSLVQIETDSSLIGDLVANEDYMSVSDLDLRSSQRATAETDNPIFASFLRVSAGDTIIVPCVLAFDMPRRVAPNQMPRKVFTIRPSGEVVILSHASARAARRKLAGPASGKSS